MLWINLNISPPTFSTFFIQVDAPFAIVVLNGEITVYKTLFGSFQMVVQLIQNLVWILLSGESMDPLKQFEWILNGSTPLFKWYRHVCAKTNGHFWKWKFWMVSNGLSVGGLNSHPVNISANYSIHVHVVLSIHSNVALRQVYSSLKLDFISLFLKVIVQYMYLWQYNL